MKKTRFLLLITIVLILLVGLAAFVQAKKGDLINTNVTTDTDTIVQSQSIIEVTNYTNNQLTKIDITEESSQLTFIQADGSWGIEGIHDTSSLNTAAIKVLCDNLLTLDATKKLDATNLEDFGLTAPSKIITYTLTDGSTSRILLGTPTPDNRSFYLLKEATNEIFTITASMAESIKGDITQFRTRELETIDTSSITALKASGTDIETFDIYLNTDTQQYTTSYLLKLDDGSIRDVSTNNLLALLKLIPSPITIEYFVADDVTDLGPYGLDTPTLDLYLENMTTETEQATQIHYLWGNTTDDGQIYFMKAGTQSVYSMNGEFMKSLRAAFDPFSLSAKFTQLTNIADVMQIDITFPDSTYTLKIDGENYTLNDKALSSDTFKAIYKNIIGISADTQFKDATLPTEYLITSFTFTSPEGEKTTYNYYSYDNQFYQTQFKGQTVVGCNIKQFNYLQSALTQAIQN